MAKLNCKMFGKNLNGRSALLLLLLIVVGLDAWAHKNHGHDSTPAILENSTAVRLVSQSYDSRIRPILTRKCADCHSNQTNFPWYYKFPFARNLIDQDISEAKRHLDISKGFPFQGHGTPISDLEEIGRTIKDESMPPTRYKILHPSSALSENEKEEVLRWINESLVLLKGK